jgi:hypothetical protein
VLGVPRRTVSTTQIYNQQLVQGIRIDRRGRYNLFFVEVKHSSGSVQLSHLTVYFFAALSSKDMCYQYITPWEESCAAKRETLDAARFRMIECQSIEGELTS